MFEASPAGNPGMDLTTVEPRSCEQVFGFNIRALITILMLYLYYCSYRIVGPRTLFYIIIKAPYIRAFGSRVPCSDRGLAATKSPAAKTVTVGDLRFCVLGNRVWRLEF